MNGKHVIFCVQHVEAEFFCFWMGAWRSGV